MPHFTPSPLSTLLISCIVGIHRECGYDDCSIESFDWLLNPPHSIQIFTPSFPDSTRKGHCSVNGSRIKSWHHRLRSIRLAVSRSHNLIRLISECGARGITNAATPSPYLQTVTVTRNWHRALATQHILPICAARLAPLASAIHGMH